MTGLLVSPGFVAHWGDRLTAAARAAGLDIEFIHLPRDVDASLDAETLARIDISYLTRDVRFSPLYASYGRAVSAAPNLKWVHFVSTGIDQHPFLASLIQRGVRLTTSTGSNGEPVGQTAIGALLYFARGFNRWLPAQQAREWRPLRGDAMPRDLHGQTIVIVGLGTIGATVARFCREVGMRVIGVRRSPQRPDDPVDVMHRIEELPAVLPLCDWIVLACPHTHETHHILNRTTLALLPPHAHVLNVARGGVLEEAALIDALRGGRLAGAYLDVFEEEPLPEHSPLWDLPNLLISPHNASASQGNDERATGIFLANLAAWARGETMAHERLA